MFVEAVRRCRYCGNDMTDTVPAESYRENPYCGECLAERLREADEAIGPTRVVRSGHYVSYVPVSGTAPAGI
jgi:hypothetical protein